MATTGLAPLPSKKKKKKKTHEKLLRLIWSVIWDLNKNQQANSVDLKKKKKIIKCQPQPGSGNGQHVMLLLQSLSQLHVL